MGVALWQNRVVSEAWYKHVTHGKSRKLEIQTIRLMFSVSKVIRTVTPLSNKTHIY